MKKIILLMLMLSPFANANMDNICNVQLESSRAYALAISSILKGQDPDPTFNDEIEQIIKAKGCERNNILMLRDPNDIGAQSSILNWTAAFWCRHDRYEITVGKRLRCVLYDTKPRKLLN